MTATRRIWTLAPAPSWSVAALNTEPPEAAALARRDLSANRIAASDLGATIEKYAAELTEKAKDSKASNALFNAMLRGQL